MVSSFTPPVDAGLVWLPIKELKRPLVPVIDSAKVASMVQALAGQDSSYESNKDNVEPVFPAVDVLHVFEGNKHYFFA